MKNHFQQNLRLNPCWDCKHKITYTSNEIVSIFTVDNVPIRNIEFPSGH